MAAVACLWQQWPVYDSSGLSMVAVACLWQQLVHVHRGGSFLAVACLWQLRVNTVGLFIAEAHYSLETICFPSKLRFVAI